MGVAIDSSLKAAHLKGTGKITLDWSPEKLPLGKLLGGLLGSNPLSP
jgi:hypothetical protein